MEIGTVIEGRYVVERTIASGGMATVHLVRHLGLDSLHALKVLHIPSPQIRERLLLEGRLQARLRHPNIVAVTDTLTIEGAPGLVMEYISGPSLDDHLARTRVPLADAEALFLGVLAGVEHAHRHGVVHRDLKPANVLLAPLPGGFLPKVADFGIAKVVAELAQEAGGGRFKTQTGVAMGTPAYMAPEQTESAAHVGPAADVFALGCILYDLVVGRPAFDGPHLVAILTKSREGLYDDPADVLPDLPDRVVEAIRGALAPDLEQRIPTCTELARVLTAGKVTTLSGAARPVVKGETLVPSGRYPRGLGSDPLASGLPTGPTAREDTLPRAAADTGPTQRPAATYVDPGPDPAPPPTSDEAPAPGGPTRRFAASVIVAALVVIVLVGGGILVVGAVAGGAVLGVALWPGAASDLPPEASDLPPEAPDLPPEDPGMTDEPVSGRPATEKPVTEKPATEKPATEKPATEKPATEKPAAEKPAAEKPATPTPVTPAPATASGWTLRAGNVRFVADTRTGVFRHEAPGGHRLLLVDVAVTNGTETTIEPTAPYRVRADGQSWEASPRCQLATPGSLSRVEEYRAGDTVRGSVCFEVPERVEHGTLEFLPALGARPASVRF